MKLGDGHISCMRRSDRETAVQKGQEVVLTVLDFQACIDLLAKSFAPKDLDRGGTRAACAVDGLILMGRH